MAKYRIANPEAVVALKWQPQQFAFLQALSLRHCPACAQGWAITWGNPATLICPKCATLGKRDYVKMLLLAGRQGGKTRVGTLAAVLEASMPSTYGWVTAPTYRDLADFVEPAFFAQLPQQWLEEGDWNVSDRILSLPNGSRVAFRSLEDPQSVRGPTLDWWLMDEACKVSGIAHEVGDAMLAIKEGVEILTTTPRGEDWVFERVWAYAEQGVPGYWAAKWVSRDNPSMSADYIETKRATMSPEMFRQEYEADFVTFQGAIYDSRLIDACVIDDETEAGYQELKQLLPEWPTVSPDRTALVGIDPGSDHPFAATLTIALPGTLLVVGEYEQREKPAMTHAHNLRAMAGALHPRWGVDRSQAQMILELAQHGIFAQAVEGGPGSVVAGIERVKSWMLSGRLRFVKSRTKRLRPALKSYRWAETEKRDGSSGRQEPYKRKDDLPDALRYNLMMWPHLPEAPIAGRDWSKLSESERWAMERMDRFAKQEDEKKVPEGTGEFYGEVAEEYSSYDDMYA